MKDWLYDESNHVGVDYSHKDNADIYDDQMENFRDYESETKISIEKIGISQPEILTAIDLGYKKT